MVKRGIFGVLVLAATACTDPHDGGQQQSQPPDSTPPTIVSRYPAVGDANGLASGPYRVTFSEPLDPTTANASAVRVWQVMGRIPAAVALSADGRTLRITPDVAPEIPGWVWVELTTALKDRSGNSLVPDERPWVFELPVWVEPGGAGAVLLDDVLNPRLSLALDLDDEPVVRTNSSIGLLMRFADGIWAPLVTPASPTGYGLGDEWLAGDSEGGIWNAGVSYQWPEAELVTMGCFVSQFNGSDWSAIGEFLPSTDAAAVVRDARLAVRAGTPVLLWVEDLSPYVLGGPATSLHVRAWNGASWTTWADASGPALSPTLAVGPTGAIVANWNEDKDARVAWVTPLGLEWIEPVVNVGAVSGRAAATADTNGNPLVLVGEHVSDAVVIRAKSWTGSAWRQLGDDLSTCSSGCITTPAIAIAQDGLPVVAWTEGAYGTARQLYVARFDGSRWQRLGGPLNVDPTHDVYDVALALDRYGAPVLAWPEAGSTVMSTDVNGAPSGLYNVHVKRLNR